MDAHDQAMEDLIGVLQLWYKAHSLAVGATAITIVTQEGILELKLSEVKVEEATNEILAQLMKDAGNSNKH